MGIDQRKKGPPLPAPTETDSTNGGTEVDSRVETYSVPDDGSPITVSTRRKKVNDGESESSNNKSQTSFLIDFFEGGKGQQSQSRRPSVRVKVTPSSKSRSRSAHDHIQISEKKGNRKSSYTKRITLSPKAGVEVDDTSSIRSAAEESNITDRSGAVEVEIMRGHGSPQSSDRHPKYNMAHASDISSMPTDSFLDTKPGTPERKRSRSTGEALAHGLAAGMVANKAAQAKSSPRRRSRSLSRERILVQKATEKVRSDREKSERRRRHRSRSRSVSAEHVTEGVRTPRRRSSRANNDEATLSGPDSSAFKSQLSAKSGGEQSVRSSTTSKSSINNPKLLETVEDAIRRLILPELSQLRREHSKHSHREGDRKSSGSGAKSSSSRDESTKTRHSTSRHAESTTTPIVAIKKDAVETTSQSPRPQKEKRSKRVTQIDSPKSFEREASEETVTEESQSAKLQKSTKGLVAEVVAPAAVTALTEHALQEHHSQESLEEKKRRRRRNKVRSQDESTEASRSRRESMLAPVMPLMSEINPSEITRASILSAASERPNSASQESPRLTPMKEVPRGVASPSSRTPTRTPVAAQQVLGTHHSNVSRSNLSLHSQSSEQMLNQTNSPSARQNAASPLTDHEDVYVEDHDYVSGVPAVINGVVIPGSRTLHHHHLSNDEEMTAEQFGFYQANQIVPPPLKYVPYAQERRGLSPIQSVSGYTEGDPDVPRRQSRSIHSAASYSSIAHSQKPRDSARSMKSLDSFGDVRNRHDFMEVRQGGLTDSELTQDGEYWDEQQKENNRLRSSDTSSLQDPHLKHATERVITHPNDSVNLATGQNVTSVAQNATLHTPIGVESAVASLINESELTTYSAKHDYSPRKASYASFEEGSEQQFSSRGTSPAKQDMKDDRRDSLADYEGEYELDENGRKVTMPDFRKPAAKKGAIAAIVSGAAAVVMGKGKRARQGSVSTSEQTSTDTTPQKTFKQRAMEGQIPLSPKHSVDRISDVASFEQLRMTSSSVPDAKHPMPEIGYAGEGSDVSSNQSVVRGDAGTQHESSHQSSHEDWSTKRNISKAPTPKDLIALRAAETVLVGAAASAGEAAALSHHQRQASQEHVDEWRRSSAERKRDTLVTNPYEGTSPIAALGMGLDNDVLDQPPFHHGNTVGYDTSRFRMAGSPGALPKDEGYISAANNARSPGAHTPEAHGKSTGYGRAKAPAQSGTIDDTDPFYTELDPSKRARHLSGMSQGMGSPVYDAATGHGMDRIQSKDVVALMDHLTVRDAQRSARDTEILVTLVRAAAEMRNSFEDMKKLLADTEDVIITEVQQNTDKSVQKAINGPRPQPQGAPRSQRQGSHDDMYDDLPAKKRNVFRKALKGLSMRSNNDLGKIEDMLVQLLGDVEGLKGGQFNASQPGVSYDDLPGEGASEQDRGYEAEGNAGTSTASHGSQSGHLSLPRSQANTSRGYDARKFSDHRISTVHEGDEDEPIPLVQGHVPEHDYDRDDGLLTPTQELPRGGSAPLGTPPQLFIPPASTSNDNTPTTDKSKKSRSGMGWIPKVKRWSGNSTPKVSRWSETTTSTVLKGFRNSNRNSHRRGEDQAAEMPSQSGSEVGELHEHHPVHDPYGDDKLHSGFSREDVDDLGPTLADESMLPQDDPKYKAHRNSLNLQHPQPRPHATVRYQTALEVRAHDFNSPRSPASVDFGSQVSLNRLPRPHQQYSDAGSEHSGHLSPPSASDGGYSNISAADQPSSQGPPRPPKIPEVPMKPRQPTRLQKPSPLSTEHLNTSQDTYDANTTRHPSSPRMNTHMRALSGNMAVPMRKPTGPRSMTSNSPRSDSQDERRNTNRDTFGTLHSAVSGESETF